MTNKKIGKYNVAIGRNAGFNFKEEESNQVCIGSFTKDEKDKGDLTDCVILGNGKVVIKKDVMVCLFGRGTEIKAFNPFK